MIAIITGGRNYRINDEGWAALRSTLIHNHTLIIFHGNCDGIDKSVKDRAIKDGFLHIPFEAKWGKYGKSAGPRRNRKMCQYAAKDSAPICCVFKGGGGTSNCKDEATRAGIRIVDLYNMKIFQTT